MLPEHTGGWVLLVFSYWLLYLLKPVRSDRRIFWCLVAILSAYHAVALANEFFFMVPGTDADAKRFDENAAVWAERGEWELAFSYRFYEQLLGLFYRMFGASRFMGSELSVIAVVLSCSTLLEFSKILGINRFRVSMVCVFALLPGMVIRCSTTMREAFEILLLMQGVYWGLRSVINLRLREMSFSILALTANALIHKAFLLYFLPLVGYLFIYLNLKLSWQYPSERRSRIIRAGGVLSLCVSIGLGIAMLQELPRGFEALGSVVRGDSDYAARRIEIKSNQQARANYSHQIDTSSIPSLVKTSPLAIVNYLMAPFPWQIRNAFDIYGFLVVVLRLLLLVSAVWVWVRCPKGASRLMMGALLVVFFSLAFLWAMGTTNYGTAMRHNLTHYWIIVLLGWPVLMSRLMGRAFVLSADPSSQEPSPGHHQNGVSNQS